MAYYIVYFGAFDTVIDIVRYSENEHDDYLKAVEKAKAAKEQIQYGYF